MPPRRDARSPPRVQPQNDQAEEIRLIRERLDTLEQKHGDLQKKHDQMVFLALSCSLTFVVLLFLELEMAAQRDLLTVFFFCFFFAAFSVRSGIRTLNLAIELVSPAPPPRPPAAS